MSCRFGPESADVACRGELTGDGPELMRLVESVDVSPWTRAMTGGIINNTLLSQARFHRDP